MPVAMLSSNLSFLTMTATQTRTLKDPPWRKPANSASPCKHFFHSEQIPPGATLAEIPVFWCPTWSHIFLRLPVTAWQQITKHTEESCSGPLIQYCQVDLEIHPSAYYLSIHRSISYSALQRDLFSVHTVFLTADLLWCSTPQKICAAATQTNVVLACRSARIPSGGHHVGGVTDKDWGLNDPGISRSISSRQNLLRTTSLIKLKDSPFFSINLDPPPPPRQAWRQREKLDLNVLILCWTF